MGGKLFFEKHGVIKCHTTFVARTELQQKYLKNLIGTLFGRLLRNGLFE